MIAALSTRAPALVRHAACAALLLALGALADCSSVPLTEENQPAEGPGAGYGDVARAQIRNSFHLAPSQAIEISRPRWVDATVGWSWLTCARFQDRGQERTYVLFMKNTAVVDQRYAVVTDNCGTQAYAAAQSSSDPASWATGLSPLY